MTEWKHAWALGLVAVPLLLAVIAWLWRRRTPAMAVPSALLFRAADAPLRTRLVRLPLVLRCVALAVLTLAIARPRFGERSEDIITYGVDMVIALDVSGSMKAEDMKPENRLKVAKEVVRKFIDSRKNDRLGLVAFAGRAQTQCPLTLDYGLLKQAVDRTGLDSVEEDGTAIGMGIATATNRLRKSQAKSKVVVLVTDGINNRGSLDPTTAAQLAKAVGVKVYTVGVGTRGPAPIPIDTEFGKQYVYENLPLDEDGLKSIATETGGYYFRATDEASFDEALRRIGELETTRIETREYVTYDELFQPAVLLGGVLLCLEGLLAATWLARIP